MTQKIFTDNWECSCFLRMILSNVLMVKCFSAVNCMILEPYIQHSVHTNLLYMLIIKNMDKNLIKLFKKQIKKNVYQWLFNNGPEENKKSHH